MPRSPAKLSSAPTESFWRKATASLVVRRPIGSNDSSLRRVLDDQLGQPTPLDQVVEEAGRLAHTLVERKPDGPLRIGVHDQSAPAQLGKTKAEVERQRCLADAALLARDRDQFHGRKPETSLCPTRCAPLPGLAVQPISAPSVPGCNQALAPPSRRLILRSSPAFADVS